MPSELLLALATGDQTLSLLGLGSALWPTSVAKLTTPHTAAVWLHADETVLRSRVHTGGHYDTATARERHLMDKFLARSVRYQV
ncbi:hypothetical protein [Kitasatospora sp. NPDC097643]|uniref:hypothetical protein n=1 Tax=Kitasatospora sp. NPDC097643 TaxID=3157230 RepID=UPI00332B46F7